MTGMATTKNMLGTYCMLRYPVIPIASTTPPAHHLKSREVQMGDRRRQTSPYIGRHRNASICCRTLSARTSQCIYVPVLCISLFSSSQRYSEFSEWGGPNALGSPSGLGCAWPPRLAHDPAPASACPQQSGPGQPRPCQTQARNDPGHGRLFGGASYLDH